MKKVNGMKKVNVKVILLAVAMLTISLFFTNIKNVNAEEGMNKKVALNIKENKTSNQKQELSKGEQINERLKNLTNICKDIKNSYECAKAIENQEIKKYPDLAKRVGDKLILKMDDGSEIIYKDSNDSSYSFQTYIKEKNITIVHEQFWEAETYYLINNKSSNYLKAPNFSFFGRRTPIFSNSATKFVLYHWSEMDSVACGLEILSIKNESFVNEYSNKKCRYYDSVKWENENLIKINYKFKTDDNLIGLKNLDNKWIELENNKK